MKTKMLFTSMLCILVTMSVSDAAETVKIGAVFAKTGTAVLYTLHDLEAIRLAVEELNAQGGLLGKQIELLEFDNKSTAITSKLAAENAVKAGVSVVLGAGWSSHSLAMAPVLQDAKIPMISDSSTNPHVTRIGDYIFRVCFTDPFQGAVMANFAFRDLKARTAIVLTNTGNQYSPGLAQAFIERFQQQGGKILWEGDYLEQVSDFMNLLTRVKTLRPDVIFLPGYSDDSGSIIHEARAMGIQTPFIGGDGWTLQMYKSGGDAVEGSYYSGHWHQDSPDERSREFVNKYIARYGEITHSGVPLAYDSVYLLADAVRRAHSLEPARIRDALAATVNFQGVTGTITFDEHGDPVKSAVILQFAKGKSVYVKTVEP